MLNQLSYRCDLLVEILNMLTFFELLVSLRPWNNAQLLRDSKPIRLLETSRSLSEYILIVYSLSFSQYLLMNVSLWTNTNNFSNLQIWEWNAPFTKGFLQKEREKLNCKSKLNEQCVNEWMPICNCLLKLKKHIAYAARLFIHLSVLFKNDTNHNQWREAQKMQEPHQSHCWQSQWIASQVK